MALLTPPTQRHATRGDHTPEHHEDVPSERNFARLPAWLSESPWWAASALIHAIALVLFATWIVGSVEPRREESRTIVRSEIRPPEYDPTVQRKPHKRPSVIDDRKNKKPIIPNKIEPITPKPKGTSLENITRKNLDHDLSDLAGLSGGPAGQYGWRNGTGVARAARGASEASESAVRAALLWLVRHQHPDGYWSSSAFTEQCPGEACKSKPGGPVGDHGLGMAGYDVGVTGLAMLAFMASGHTHQSGTHRDYKLALRKATRWMLRQQDLQSPPLSSATDGESSTRGVYGPTEGESWVYNHAIAAMAMSELLGMTSDARLKRSVTEATEWILRAQNAGLGWKYGYQDSHSDSSVTGWMMLGLKGARLAAARRLVRIDVERFDRSFEGALHWFDLVTGTGSGITGYDSPGDPGSSLGAIYPEPYPFAKQQLRCMTAVAVWCRILAGQKRSDRVRKGVDILMEHPPQWRPSRGKLKSTINLYHWYYATNALYQYGGPKWKKWNAAMQEALIGHQRQGDIHGDEDGSWDPIGEWGPAGGRVYATAIGALTLQVYYRYERTK